MRFQLNLIFFSESEFEGMWMELAHTLEDFLFSQQYVFLKHILNM